MCSKLLEKTYTLDVTLLMDVHVRKHVREPGFLLHGKVVRILTPNLQIWRCIHTDNDVLHTVDQGGVEPCRLGSCETL